MYRDKAAFALRALARNPGSSLVIVLVLAVGIGAITAVFSVVNNVVLEPLPYPRSHELVAIRETNQELGRFQDGPSPANVLDWRERNRVFSGIAASHASPITHFGEGEIRELSSARVSADYFRVMGTEARLGRVFTAGQVERDQRVAVLSHGLHQRAFGGDPGIVGGDLVLEGEKFRIVGVMPPEFVHPGANVELWLPWNLRTAYAGRGGPPRDFRFLDVAARLKPGVSLEQARADLERVASDLARQYPGTNAGWSVRLVPLRDSVVGAVDHTLWVLFGAVAFVFLVGCANAAALLLARVLRRIPEYAVRQVMGASRARLLVLGLTEGLSLAALGGAAGFVFAHGAVRLLLALQPVDLPRLQEVAIDGGVLAFTLLATLLAGVLSGGLPAYAGIRRDLSMHLKAGAARGLTAGRSIRRLCRMLVVAELAAALVLLVGAGLLARSYAGLRAVDPGFQAEHVLVAQMNLDPNAYDQDDTRDYYARFLQALETRPGVESTGAVSALPMNPVGVDFDRPYWLPGKVPPESTRPEAAVRIATPDYFKTMGMRLREGRGFNADDRGDGLPVVVVNQTLADRLWGDRSPVDRELTLDYRGVTDYRVVGMVGDTRHRGLRSEPRPEIFLPHARVPYLPMSVAIRTIGEPESLANQVRQLARQMDPGQPVQSIATLDALVSASIARERFVLILLISLAVTALSLAIMGTYGLLTLSVQHRTREIALRLALGAKGRNVLRMILGESLKLASLGTLLGLALALGLTQLLSRLLFGVGPFDVATFAVAGSLLAATAVLASLIPARRAMRMEPATVLREE